MEVMTQLGWAEWLSLGALMALFCLAATFLSYRRRIKGVITAREELSNRVSRQLRSAIADTRALLNQTSQIIMVFDRHAPVLLFANQQALDMFGKHSVDELMDQVISRPDAWLVAPHRLVDFEEWLGKVKAIGVERREWCFRTGEDDHLWVAATISNTAFEGRPARLFAANNIHGEKMNQIAEHLRNRALVDIMSGRSLQSVLDTIAKLAEVTIAHSHCVLSLYDDQSANLSSTGSSPFARKFQQMFPVITSLYGSTSIGTAFYVGGRVIVENLQSDHRWQGYGAQVSELGMTASWSEVIPGKDKDLLGVITLFFEYAKHPTDQEIADFSSVVFLASLAIERHTWQVSLETALSGERFIRDIGVRLAGAEASKLWGDLESVLLRIKGHYDLGSITLWERPLDTDNFRPVASTSSGAASRYGDDPSPLTFSISDLDEKLGGRSTDYVMPQDSMYRACCVGHDNRPVLLLPLSLDANTIVGVMTLQSRYFYISKSAIDYLLILGSMIATSMMNARLVKSMSQSIEREKGAREKLEGELSVAREIQMSMVPLQGEFRGDYKDWTIEALLNPASAVGGDLYDVIRCQGGKLLLVVGDVSDKGVPAALFMAKTVSLINYLAKAEGSDLQRIVTKLNAELCVNNESCMFVTAVFGLLDLANGELKFINAGHNAPLLVQSFMTPELIARESGPPLGLYEEVQFPSFSVTIEQGATVTLYSDGVTESFNESGEEFGDGRLIQIGYRANDMDNSFLTILKSEIEQFSGYAPQSDDITIMTIQRHVRAL